MGCVYSFQSMLVKLAITTKARVELQLCTTPHHLEQVCLCVLPLVLVQQHVLKDVHSQENEGNSHSSKKILTTLNTLTGTDVFSCTYKYFCLYSSLLGLAHTIWGLNTLDECRTTPMHK